MRNGHNSCPEKKCSVARKKDNKLLVNDPQVLSSIETFVKEMVEEVIPFVSKTEVSVASPSPPPSGLGCSPSISKKCRQKGSPKTSRKKEQSRIGFRAWSGADIWLTAKSFHESIFSTLPIAIVKEESTYPT